MTLIRRNGLVVVATGPHRPDDDPTPPAATGRPARWAHDPLDDLLVEPRKAA